MGGGLRLDNRQRSSDCARRFPRDASLSGYENMTASEAPVEKMAPKRKCKFNDDWRSHFAWIAKLPDNGMAQCNLCVADFSISSGGRTDVRRHQESAHHAKLALRRRVGWSSVLRF